MNLPGDTSAVCVLLFVAQVAAQIALDGINLSAFSFPPVTMMLQVKIYSKNKWNNSYQQIIKCSELLVIVVNLHFTSFKENLILSWLESPEFNRLNQVLLKDTRIY
jgi:hypothetical protein